MLIIAEAAPSNRGRKKPFCFKGVKNRSDLLLAVTPVPARRTLKLVFVHFQPRMVLMSSLFAAYIPLVIRF